MHIPTTMIVGHQKEAVQALIVENHHDSINFVVQHEQLGTGHAIICARDIWQEEYILIMNGDMPLVTADIIERLYKKHRETEAVISFVTAHNTDPLLYDYDRVVQTKHSIEIVPGHKFNGDELDNCCVNAGIYIVTKEFLEKHVDEIERNDVSHQFQLVDLVNIANQMKLKIATISAPFDLIRSVDTFQELWAVEHIKRSELIRHWMHAGVRFTAAQSVHIDFNVTIGAGTQIGSGVHLLNGTHIGTHCTIGEFTLLSKVNVADNVQIKSHCVLKDVQVYEGAVVGPFA